MALTGDEGFSGPARLDHLPHDLREVLELAAEGLTNKAIAKRIGIGVRTVERRRSEALKSLRVGTVVEAARLLEATRRGQPLTTASLFEEVFRGAEAGLSVAGPDGRYVAANSAFCRLLGFSEAEIAGVRIADVTHPEHLEADLAGTRRVLAGELAVYRTRKRYLGRHGKVVPAELTVTPVRGPDGTPSFTLGYVVAGEV